MSAVGFHIANLQEKNFMFLIPLDKTLQIQASINELLHFGMVKSLQKNESSSLPVFQGYFKAKQIAVSGDYATKVSLENTEKTEPNDSVK